MLGVLKMGYLSLIKRSELVEKADHNLLMIKLCNEIYNLIL